MPQGPGKYDEVCTIARELTDACAVVLIVLNGKRGTGFSVQSHRWIAPPVLADLLEQVVRQLRAEGANGAAHTDGP